MKIDLGTPPLVHFSKIAKWRRKNNQVLPNGAKKNRKMALSAANRHHRIGVHGSAWVNMHF